MIISSGPPEGCREGEREGEERERGEREREKINRMSIRERERK